MKILHVIPYFQPEYGYEEYYTVKWESKLGNDIYIITSDRIYPFKGLRIKERYRGAGIERVKYYTLIRLKTVIELPNELILIKGIKHKLLNIKPDIIHIHGGKTFVSLYTAYIAQKYNIPYIVDSHEYNFNSLAHYKKTNYLLYYFLRIIYQIQYNMIRKPMTCYVYKNAKVIVPVTNACQEFINRYYSIYGRKSILVPLGVDHEKFYFSDIDRVNIRNQLEIKNDELLLIFVSSSYNPFKNFKQIISIVYYIEYVKILLIGSKKYLECNRSQELMSKKRLFYYEYINSSELYKYYSASDLSLFVYHRSVAIYESMACECPVITTNFGDEKEIIKDSGYVLENPETDFLNVIIKHKNNSVIEINKMRKRAREIIISNYSYQLNADRLIKIYKSVL